MLVSYEYDSKVYPSDSAAANKRQAMQLKTRKKKKIPRNSKPQKVNRVIARDHCSFFSSFTLILHL